MSCSGIFTEQFSEMKEHVVSPFGRRGRRRKKIPTFSDSAVVRYGVRNDTRTQKSNVKQKQRNRLFVVVKTF
jgi:hypothetical protein